MGKKGHLVHEDLVTVLQNQSTHKEECFQKLEKNYLQKQSSIITFIRNACAHMERVSKMDSQGPAN
jgi:hypothetical protein